MEDEEEPIEEEDREEEPIEEEEPIKDEQDLIGMKTLRKTLWRMRTLRRSI